jgi:hypothetical protein
VEGKEDEMKSGDLESQLRQWRENRARKQSVRPMVNDRRTVRVNGQEVVVVTKPKRTAALD